MTENQANSYQHLLHRRQFFLSAIKSRCFDIWPCWDLTHFYLYAHPDLTVKQVHNPNTRITLVGDMVDPWNVTWTNHEILEHLLQNDASAESLCEATGRFAGRWLLIAQSQAFSIVLNDPAGFRQIVFTAPGIENRALASQPGLIAKEFGFDFNFEITEKFIKTAAFSTNPEYWWPGDKTPYSDVKHLTPNHYLDLQSWEVRRFWPCKVRQSNALEALPEVVSMLRGLIDAAIYRWPLALPITAGLDSRVLLAATRQHQAEIDYYTLLYPPNTLDSPDITVPNKMLVRLGLTHHVISCEEKMPTSFEEIYFGNVVNAHPYWGQITYGLIGQAQSHRVSLKAVCNEIARCRFYRDGPYPKKITGELLALYSGMGGNRFAASAFSEWLDGAKHIESAFGYRVLDLFHWEQRLGNWQAMSQLESDIAIEQYAPFNCRLFLELLLSIDEKYRKPPNDILFLKVIENLWPDLLMDPINPKPLKRRIKTGLKRLLKYAGVYKGY